MMNTLLKNLQGRIRIALAAATMAALAIAAMGASAQDITCPHCDPQSITFNPSWVQQFPVTSPPAREAAALVYDANHGQVVLFGGDTNNGGDAPLALGDTWTWNGTTWTQQFPTASPSARTSMGATYDGAQAQVLLMGGRDSGDDYLTDTWVWNGIDWTKLAAANSCPGLEYPEMAYDGGHGQVVAIGFPVDGSNSATCIWNGTTWTRESPSTLPPAPDQGGMTYDAAAGQVLLYGGFSPTGESESPANQTWNWTGTTWTQLLPATDPGPQANFGFAYDPGAALAVMFTEGTQTYAWNGAAWRELFPSISPPTRVFPSMTYDGAHGQLLLFGGWGRNSAVVNDTWTLQFGSASLGTANVCATGKAIPAPCSQSVTLNFTITDETVGSIKVLTEGSPNLDFNQSPSGGTCTAGAYPSATACTVNVTFAPTVPGERKGAVVFYDDSGNVLASVPIYGTGIAPQVAFSPAAETTLGGGFANPNGVVVDGAGNVYVADYSNSAVKKMHTGCASATCVTTVGGGFSAPAAVAIDGVGNIYVADYSDSAVKEMPSSCGSASCVITLGGGFNHPSGVAVDGMGNVYIADFSNSAVKEMPAGCSSASCVSTLAGGFSEPTSVTVDGNGNVYVSDYGNGEVKEFPAGCPSSSCVKTLGGGFKRPSAVALDGGDDVYVVDSVNLTVTEMPAGCASAGCVTTLAANFSNPTGVTVDGNGNVYVADYGSNELSELNRAAAPALSFAATDAGSTSTDSPKVVTAENIGNTGLNISSLSYAADFPEASPAPDSDCVSDSTLAPGASCTLTIDFSPLATSTPGLLSEDVQLVYDTLYVFNGVQQISLKGTEVELKAPKPRFSEPGGTYDKAVSVTITDATPPAIYYTTDGTTPTPNVGTTQAYSAAIAVSTTTILKAVAMATDYTLSAVATAKYTIKLPPAKKPTFKPAAGTYHAAQHVAILDTTAEATIYYTTNGKTPTTSSAVYEGPILVSASGEIEAIAVAPGFSKSAVAKAKYDIVPK